VLLLLGSLGLNALLLCGGLALSSVAGDSEGPALNERFHGGTAGAADKIAVVRIEGVIMEGFLGYAHKQIERAAGDKGVKAVVVRIESPGGTITASDELHRRLVQLRDGTTPKFQTSGTAPKPLVVSMGNLAASGGYYIAMPGVYASFPNAEELARKYGVEMDMIKAGDIKGSGSLFHKMTPQERQPWEDMVNHAYNQFLAVVEAGRPQLKGKLTEDLFPPKTIPLHDDRGNVLKSEDGKSKTAEYTRKRADGGIFTSDEALKYGLVDAVGPLEDAIAEAARQAGVAKYKAVTYEKPLSLLAALTGNASGSAPTAGGLDVGRLVNALGPRVWYLVPQAEGGALLQALRRE
jgi:protease IV